MQLLIKTKTTMMERKILAQMTELFNNSQLTNMVANSVFEKLTSKELNDFLRWLQHANDNKRVSPSIRRRLG